MDIIRRRWPDIAEQLAEITPEMIDRLEPVLIQGRQQTIAVCDKQLSSRHDRDREATHLLQHIPDGLDRVLIFGMGLGDVPALALSRWTDRPIELCLMSMPITAMVLNYTNQTEWLCAPNLTLRRPLWTDCYAGPWTAIIPELQLADPDLARVRDHLVMTLQRPFVDLQHQLADKNNASRIEQTLKLLQTLPNVATLFTRQNPRAIVIGAGPSLEKAYEWLYAGQQAPDRACLIAADTAHKALTSRGIVPDIVVTLDARINAAHLNTETSADSTLVCFPSTDPEVIRAWQGPRMAALTKSPTQDKYADHLPCYRLFSGGSVIHPALDIAVQCGATEIILCGCDFGFPDGKSHAYWQDGALGVTHDNAGHTVENYHGQNIATTLNMRGYLLAVELFIKRHPNVRFFNHSGMGASISDCPVREC
ncbi:DUF115 domain-containing protein [Shewanella sp. JM162201]|uniref:DUF115 domain-containing protein n=1 Tax=Shewanella jiangmenensis TaxID=2837387 RepID=A0ABS5V514_9GAMM|nr:6-hydroxymethylpterin diphosphokinase MptE-like protein [Shewanella jiangmenensis]MBT1444935.1 DUF115 domain-containing protein [Shewanella jiangmenensis]